MDVLVLNEVHRWNSAGNNLHGKRVSDACEGQERIIQV
jgi:hypothetical protein